MWQVFGDDMPSLIKKHSVKTAIDRYKALQFNPKIEYIKKFQDKIDTMFQLLAIEDVSSKIESLTKNIISLKSTVQKLEHEVDEDIKNEGVIRGGAQRSLLEELQTNMKHYKSILTSKPIKNEVL